MQNDHHHHAQGYRRGPRLARLLTVVAAFAATTAGLHALSDHYGWRQRHWGSPTYNSYGWPGSEGHGCDNSQPGRPKQAS
ncbi:MAG: hypothetical protein HXX19_11530 [Rhodoferax sp.]|nr:hypothetical protein [Rhodoferax sp.]